MNARRQHEPPRPLKNTHTLANDTFLFVLLGPTVGRQRVSGRRVAQLADVAASDDGQLELVRRRRRQAVHCCLGGVCWERQHLRTDRNPCGEHVRNAVVARVQRRPTRTVAESHGAGNCRNVRRYSVAPSTGCHHTPREVSCGLLVNGGDGFASCNKETWRQRSAVCLVPPTAAEAAGTGKAHWGSPAVRHHTHTITHACTARHVTA